MANWPDVINRWFFQKVLLRDAYKSFWNSAEGLIVLADLRTFCAMEHPILDTGDTHRTVARLGARSVYLRILKKSQIADEEIRLKAEQMAKGVLEGPDPE